MGKKSYKKILVTLYIKLDTERKICLLFFINKLTY